MSETYPGASLLAQVPDFAIPLGDGHALLWLFLAAAVDRVEGTEYGAIVTHQGKDGALCVGGYIVLAGPEQKAREPHAPVWTVESREPLTLSPSLLCRICGDHGFVREGRWVRA